MKSVRTDNEKRGLFSFNLQQNGIWRTDMVWKEEN